MFLANFLIALREGLEAALIVGVLVAYLVKVGRRDLLPRLWAGVAVAALIPLTAGAFMTWGPYTMTFAAQEVLGGTLSLLAVALITWMVLWMGRHAADQKAGLESSMAGAVDGSGRGIVWIALIAVGRESLETAMFVWATTRSTMATSAVVPAVAVLCGLAAAAVLGAGVYAGAVRIDIGAFFRWSGVFLIVVAAGIVSYGLGDLQEASVLPGWGAWAYDLSHLVPTSGIGLVVYTLAVAIVNVNLMPTWLQVLGWAAYLVVVLPLFLRASRRRPRRAAVDVTGSVTSSGSVASSGAVTSTEADADHTVPADKKAITP
ncbi:iron uptake transporter permease EfeU [Dietzia sp. SYD-A1]|uniref:iron uptake transporter permease EfeU n=1 Tax=Dietzia sp. SYD-A1 TaxID=2780141 RepID=UPI001891CA6A|nr:iron uptake transporter permease EfeU [Dietzia sp. SYD-A1]